MTKLSDLQLILLSTAAGRDDSSLLPPPDSIGNRSSTVDKAIKSLIRRGLAAGIDTSEASAPVPADHDSLTGVRITGAGRDLLGIESMAHGKNDSPSAVPPTESRAKPAKASHVLSMLQRPDGTTLDELVTATGWLPHTTRAALTGLRKKGHQLASEKIEGVRRYSMAVAVQAGPGR